MKSSRFPQNRFTRRKPSGFFHRTANLFIALAILVVFTAMMISLFKNVHVFYVLHQERKILIENQQQVIELEKKVVDSKTPAFIEHYAREKLDMLKSGEFVIIVNSE